MFRTLTSDEMSQHEADLARDGYTVVPWLLDEAAADAVLACLNDLHATQAFGDNEFTGTRTKRVFNLFQKTRGLDLLLTNADVLQLVRSVLGPEAQLSIASTMEIHPGETSQALHRDDAYFPINPHVPLVLNTMWALSDFTEENGATRVVPGSQHRTGAVFADHSIPIEMPRGSVLLWDGQLWHGGGANRSSVARFGMSLNFCRGWIRQQENQYLSLDSQMVASLPEQTQKLLGYDICQFVGYADGRHPMRAIIPEVRERIFSGRRSKREVPAN